MLHAMQYICGGNLDTNTRTCYRALRKLRETPRNTLCNPFALGIEILFLLKKKNKFSSKDNEEILGGS